MSYETIDWPERVRTLQTNWIGRSEGAAVVFHTEQGDEMEVFTTRPDTLWGVTFMVLAPEHPLVAKVTTPEQQAEVEAYQQQAKRQSDIQREAADKEKTGVFTGGYAINPVNGERIPIWIADYVLMTYGTGAIMAVPAHDERDFEFARKFGLPIRVVVQPDDMEPIREDQMTAAVPATGTMVNSGPLTGTPATRPSRTPSRSWKARAPATAVNYRLRDWLISRQRYWGAPIPMVFCKECGTVPVPDDQLPVLLPDDVEWKPTGESPLKLHPTWRFTTCPQCGGPAERETDTMDTFMCSSWYHLRYLSPQYDQGPFDPDEYDYWMPVDTLYGRHRARQHAPDLHALLPQGPARYGHHPGPRADAATAQPGHGAGQGRRKNVQEPRQRGCPGRPGAGLRRRYGARLPDVLRALGTGRPVGQITSKAPCAGSGAVGR